MSWTLYEITEPIAKKRYRCEATWRYLSNFTEFDVDEKDRKIFNFLIDNQYIEKGEKYRKIKGIFDGKFCTFRAKIQSDDLCHKYDWYDE